MNTRGTPPAVTVGVLTYNYGHYIRDAIESVLAQTRTDWEMIIADDASTDDTASIVQPYLDDPRIRYVRHRQNLGQAENWSFVLDQGAAPVVAVLHADDQWLPNTLATALPHFEAEPELDLLYGNWWIQDGSGTLKLETAQEEPSVLSGHEAYRHQVVHNTWRPSATFARRAAINQAGRPNPAFSMVVDLEYFLRVAFRSRRVRAVTEPLAVYREHEMSISVRSTANGRHTEERERLPEVAAQYVKAYPALRDSVRKLRLMSASGIFNDGVTTLVLGRPDAGRALMARALQLDAMLLRTPKFLVDYLLSRLGPPGYALIRMMHRERFHLNDNVKQAYLEAAA